ncbi:unnamed protein product [Lepeophtheirus salmonis]|uniref:(salmon louse) hypothetical protein n=1 Tax=Lepeophtheirus salmonis TaxID=72036 RepID=A0A7R8CJ58_LEPSM|nr:unnamed protein product [Lepeophtheirus salmonis]CAF2839205.1 unnamed protein product [Lepeophtheirus salmonis]
MKCTLHKNGLRSCKLATFIENQTCPASDETKHELFSHRDVAFAKNEAFKHKNTLPTVKNGGGSIMLQGCISAICPGNLVLGDGTMKKDNRIAIIATNLKESVIKLGPHWLFQQDNDPKQRPGLRQRCSKTTGLRSCTGPHRNASFFANATSR